MSNKTSTKYNNATFPFIFHDNNPEAMNGNLLIYRLTILKQIYLLLKKNEFAYSYLLKKNTKIKVAKKIAN